MTLFISATIAVVFAYLRTDEGGKAPHAFKAGVTITIGVAGFSAAVLMIVIIVDASVTRAKAGGLAFIGEAIGDGLFAGGCQLAR